MSLSKILVYLYVSFVVFSLFNIVTLGANIGAFAQSAPKVVTNTRLYNVAILRDSNQQLVELQQTLSPFYADFKYASQTNFTGKVLYANPKAYLRLPVAKALMLAQNELKNKGLSLKIYDAYRPYSVTLAMWNAVKDSRYAAHPANGSNHNRGTAVDVTLVDISSDKELAMPTKFDDFTLKAHHNFSDLDPVIIKNRNTLRMAMEHAGFAALATEWWHYSWSAPNTTFALLDLTFDQLNSQPK